MTDEDLMAELGKARADADELRKLNTEQAKQLAALQQENNALRSRLAAVALVIRP